MRQAYTIAEYVADPVGRFVAGAHVAHAFVDAGLSALVIWGRPDVDDMRLAVAALDAELAEHSPAHVSLTDASRLEGVDQEAFEGIVRYLSSKNDALASNTTAQAVLRPRGLPGAIVAGFYEVAIDAYNTRIFDDPKEALAWLHRDEIDLSALDEMFTFVTGVDPVLRGLREHLARAYADATLASTARALGVAPRTLQEHLQSASTSFRAELTGARVTAARALLENTDTKLSAIALEVGCASLQHFSTLFRKATGTSPSAFRAARRRPND